ASTSATFDVVIATPLPAGVTEVTNLAQVDSDELPPKDSNEPIVPVSAQPDLVIAKEDGGITLVPGGTVVYTLTYDNVGSQTATNVVLTETVPARTVSGVNPGWEVAPVGSGLPCDGRPAGTVCVFSLGTVAVGAGGSETFSVVLNDPKPAGVSDISNTASIADDGANGADPTPDNNSDSELTPIDAAPDLALGKDDGGQIAAPGDTILYTLSYANLGDQGATGVVLAETVPMHTTSAVNPGWEVSPVGSTIACDGQLAGTVCVLSVGALAAGDAGTALFSVTVDTPLPIGVEQVLNAASIADDGTNGPDADPDNNDADEPTEVVAAPDLTVTKDDGGVVATPGATITYTLGYANVGDQDAVGVVLTETVPVATTSATNPGWEVAPVGSSVPCDGQPAGTSCVFSIGALAAGDAGTATFEVSVDAPKPAGVEEILNTVSIADDGSNGPDPTPDDNEATEPTPADAGPDLAVDKDDGDVVAMPGDTVVYTLDYTNVGDQNASGVVLTDTVPDNTSSGTNPGWEVAPAGSGVPCDGQPAGTVCILTIGDLAAGASGQAMFAIVIDNPLAAGIMSLTNTVSIADDGSSGPDQNPDDNDSSDSTEVVGTPSLEVLKTAEQPTGDGYQTGDVFAWTVTLLNTGDQDLADLDLIDVLPPEVLYVPESMLLAGVPLTDVAGDDAGEFDGAATLTARIALVAVGDLITFTFLTEVSGEDPEEDGLVFNQAAVTDPDGGTTLSDDPDTSDVDDPTDVPIVLTTVLDIPTADTQGLLLLGALLALAGSLHLASRRRRG
ncbi:MAG: hypothetical protein AAGN46_01080, partial [Acidobacteriota bacterium]